MLIISLFFIIFTSFISIKLVVCLFYYKKNIEKQIWKCIHTKILFKLNIICSTKRLFNCRCFWMFSMRCNGNVHILPALVERPQSPRQMMTLCSYKCPDSTSWVSRPVGHITQGLYQQWSSVFMGKLLWIFWMDATYPLQNQTLAHHMGWTGHYSHNKKGFRTRHVALELKFLSVNWGGNGRSTWGNGKLSLSQCVSNRLCPKQSESFLMH